MIDERSEAIGYAEYYAMERGLKRGRAEARVEYVALLREAIALIEALSEQQAMADDWYKPVLERLRAALD